MPTQQQPVNMPQTYADAIQATQHIIARLTTHRADMVHNFQLFQEKAIEAVKLIDQTLASEGEKLQHLFNMQNGRPAPQAQAQAAPQGQPQAQAQPQQQQQAPIANTVEVTQPPPVQAQVAEVIEANGQRTIFDNGQPVMVVPPQAGAAPNGGVVQ